MLPVFVAVLVVLLAVCGILAMATRGAAHRLDRARALRTLEDVVAGRASDADWTVFMGLPVHHDPLLVELRQRCLAIEQSHYVGESSFRGPHLLDRQGLHDIGVLLHWLQQRTDSRDI